MPFQLSSEDLDETALEPHDLVNVRLSMGDIVIAGSDGLFDNMSDMEVEKIVLEHFGGRPRLDPKLVPNLTEQILKIASAAARSPMEEMGTGKLDDITVIVAQAD